eukprot:CAMPEP_0179167046 /NCGR_PEP_ID=MMETSP0796-20121207/82105_1 /TAXON_ID=73915 /ORGANISM="Pyrodinium bahamense, Strain pbaha01" /LENGTH=392 /DNA_ID=CAMNT_0020869699 /DNA_START=41 /DNA_END=1219 /DNA_ORIENTATION=+
MTGTAHKGAEPDNEVSCLLANSSAPVAASAEQRVMEPAVEAAPSRQVAWALLGTPCARSALVLLAAAVVSSGAAFALVQRPRWAGPGPGRVSPTAAFLGREATPQPRPQVIHTFVPSAGYTGPLRVTGKMEIRTTPVAPFTQKLEWHLSGVDPQCGVVDITGIAGACGIHIHEGTDCSQGAGGHYFAGAHDPWGVVHYAAKDGCTNLGGPADPSGFVNVVTEYNADAINGHTMIIHDSTGAKVACGLIRYTHIAYHEVWFSRLPSYTGVLQVSGMLRITSTGEGAAAQHMLDWHLEGADPLCGTVPITSVPGACGLHIHEGMDCASEVGGHYFAPTPADPWGKVTYSVLNGGSDGHGVVVVTGLTPDQVNGHTVIVHDSTGAKAACGTMVYQ